MKSTLNIECPNCSKIIEEKCSNKTIDGYRYCDDCFEEIKDEIMGK